MKMSIPVATFVCALANLCAAEEGASRLAEAIDPERLRAHIAFLADDSLGGRLGGSAAEARAAAALADRLAEYGLAAFGDSRIQEFPLVDFAVDQRASLEIAGRQSERFEDFTPLVFSASGEVEAETVLAEPGVSLEGKIALVALGPDGDPALLAQDARDRGAKAVIFLWSAPKLPRAQGVISRGEHLAFRAARRGLSLVRDGVARASGTFKIGAMDPEVFLPQFLDPILSREGPPISTGGWPARREIAIPVVAARADLLRPGVRARLSIRLSRRLVVSRNVIGWIPATEDPDSAPAIVLGAHFDHVGKMEPPTGLLARLWARDDYIWNGADDNASGTAALLEIARIVASAPGPRRRHLVVVAFGSEEYGLVGSEAYCRQPAFPLERTCAMLNLDMIGRNPDGPVYVAGVGSSSALGAILDGAVASLGRPLAIREDDEYLMRSDQAAFLARRIPALFLSTGEHPDYHEASDELERLSIDRVAEVARLAAALVERLESAPVTPTFHEPYLERLGAAPGDGG